MDHKYEVIYGLLICTILMTLSDLQGHTPIASFLNAIFQTVVH